MTIREYSRSPMKVTVRRHIEIYTPRSKGTSDSVAIIEACKDDRAKSSKTGNGGSNSIYQTSDHAAGSSNPWSECDKGKPLRLQGRHWSIRTLEDVIRFSPLSRSCRCCCISHDCIS